jgi:hypothetical protein
VNRPALDWRAIKRTPARCRLLEAKQKSSAQSAVPNRGTGWNDQPKKT